MSFISSPKGEDKVQNVHSFSIPTHLTACDTSEHVSKSAATLSTCWKTSGEIYSQLCSWQHNTCNVRVHFPFYIVLLSSHHICFSHYSNWQYRLPIQRRNSIPATKLTQILRPPATNNPRPRNWNSHRTALQLLCVWSPVPFLSNVNSLPRQVACTAQAILQTAAVPKLPKFVDPEPTGPIRFTCQVRSAGGRIWMCPFCTGETCSWFSPLQMTGVITTVFLYILNFFGI